MIEITATEIRPPSRRIQWLDILRGVALLAMASYHLLWDLADFGYLEPTFPSTGWPRIYARAIASTFLFLAGLSLVLAHREGIRWRPFWKRFTAIAAAATLVTAVFYVAMPQGLVFFGILHAIAAASLVGLLFLRMHPALIVLAAIAAFIAPQFLKSELFNQPILWWIGLSTETRPSFDYVPLLPWLCPFLLGMASGRTDKIVDWLRQNASGELPKKGFQAALAFLGRHSLVVYLVHQPVLIAILSCVSLVYPAPVVEPPVRYMRSCNADCGPDQSAEFCARFCSCTLDELEKQDLLLQLQSGAISAANDERLNRIALECTARSY